VYSNYTNFTVTKVT